MTTTTAKPPARARAAVSEKTRAENRLGQRLVAPAVVMMLIVTAWPMLQALYLSLFRYRLTAPDDHVRNLRDAARLALAHAEPLLDPATPHELVPVGDTSAARGLDRIAEERAADLIVLGSSHQGGRGVLAGRTTVQRLLHGAPCPVAVAAPAQCERFGAGARIWLACVRDDGQSSSERSVASTG